MGRLGEQHTDDTVPWIVCREESDESAGVLSAALTVLIWIKASFAYPWVDNLSGRSGFAGDILWHSAENFTGAEIGASS